MGRGEGEKMHLVCRVHRDGALIRYHGGTTRPFSDRANLVISSLLLLLLLNNVLSVLAVNSALMDVAG